MRGQEKNPREAKEKDKSIQDQKGRGFRAIALWFCLKEPKDLRPYHE
jgi:hypothetical protein